jgi:hypothetical protein
MSGVAGIVGMRHFGFDGNLLSLEYKDLNDIGFQEQLSFDL